MWFKDLKYITTIAKEQSINKAAQKLYIAQPSLTKFISRFEQKLGFRIFKRTSTGVTLTEAGVLYCEFGQKVLSLATDYERKIHELQGSAINTLTIGASWYVQSYFLSKELNHVSANLSGIMPVYEEVSSKKVLDLLFADPSLDIAFVHTLPHSHLTIPSHYFDYKIAVEPFWVAVPQSYVSFSKRDAPDKIDLALLKDRKMILFKSDQQIRKLSDSILEKAQISPPVATLLHSFPTALHMVEQGNGWTILPQKYLQMALKPDAPIAIFTLAPELDAYWELHMIHAKKAKSAVKKFVSLLTKQCKANANGQVL